MGRASISSISITVPRMDMILHRLIEQMQTRQVPCFLHLHYYRYLEHVGVNEDFDAGYRARGEFERWKEKDPILLQRKKIKNLGWHEDVIGRLEADIDSEIHRSVAKAREADFSEISELCKGVLV